MMKSPLFWKISTLLGCILLLLVPLFMVSNLISERENYRNDVENTLRQSTSGPQKLVGPMIAIPMMWGGDRFCMVVMWGKKGNEAMNDGGCEARWGFRTARQKMIDYEK